MQVTTSSSDSSVVEGGTGSGAFMARIMIEAARLGGAGRRAGPRRGLVPMRSAERGYTAPVPYRFERVCGHGAYILQAATTLPQEVTMGRKLYVGNLPYSATEQSLREAF